MRPSPKKSNKSDDLMAEIEMPKNIIDIVRQNRKKLQLKLNQKAPEAKARDEARLLPQNSLGFDWGASEASELVTKIIKINNQQTPICIEQGLWDALSDICRWSYQSIESLCVLVNTKKPHGAKLERALRVFIVTMYKMQAVSQFTTNRLIEKFPGSYFEQMMIADLEIYRAMCSYWELEEASKYIAMAQKELANSFQEMWSS